MDISFNNIQDAFDNNELRTKDILEIKTFYLNNIFNPSIISAFIGGIVSQEAFKAIT